MEDNNTNHEGKQDSTNDQDDSNANLSNSGTDSLDSGLSIIADQKLEGALTVSSIFENWYLDYASYIILDRAVPYIEDGLKPVQRRIMHAMNDLDDGRYNKVANIIGTTMQYHPHGDASIADAIVNLGQKELLIDMQGNWGDNRTGDRAAAPRYIEARLSKFAKEILFNPQTTNWGVSYDGRKKEPITLPVKFPLLLAHGVEGIAVGLSTKLLPHNFQELILASIDILQNKPFVLIPDFLTGGYVDPTNYNDGKRGGRVLVRAKIEDVDKKILIIKDIPFGVTTSTLMDSIVKANEQGKIKIKKVVDNTAEHVEIQIQLAPGVSPDITIAALYKFTDCQVSIAPNCCIIIDEKPVFTSVSEVLKLNTYKTMALLGKELDIRKEELMEEILFSSLEKIFIENEIYLRIKECETWAAVISTIDKGLDPYKPSFFREITTTDIERLTEIKIKRISKFDAFKSDELIKGKLANLKEVEYNILHLRQYAIEWYKMLLKKYGKGKERKTEIKTFDTITAAAVAANNQKLYVNRVDGFVGYGIKKDEFITDCSDIDDVIAFKKDGTYKIVKIDEKVFVGKDIIHCGIFRKADDRMVYNAIYFDGETGNTMVKRFLVNGITRDKDYTITRGVKGSKLTYFTANPNGEAETITIQLIQGCTAKQKVFDYSFKSIDIKGRASQGNILTKYPVKKVTFKTAGGSTLGGINVYFDATIGRLNTDNRGTLVGNFEGNDLLLILTKDGCYEVATYDLTLRFDADTTISISKYRKDRPLNTVYFDASTKVFMLKRFVIETSTIGKKFSFIPDTKGNYLLAASTGKVTQLEITTLATKKDASEVIIQDINVLAEVKSAKALGTKLLAGKPIVSVNFILDETPDLSDTIPQSQNEDNDLLLQQLVPTAVNNLDILPKEVKPFKSAFGINEDEEGKGQLDLFS